MVSLRLTTARNTCVLVQLTVLLQTIFMIVVRDIMCTYSYEVYINGTKMCAASYYLAKPCLLRHPRSPFRHWFEIVGHQYLRVQE